MQGRARQQIRRVHPIPRTYQYDIQERLEKITTGTGADAPTTQYAHNALGQRLFKTEPLFAASGKNLNNLLADPEDQEEAESKEQDKGLIQTAYEFFTRLWSPGSSDAQKLGFAYVYGQDGTLLGEYGMGGSASTGTTQYIYLPTANGPMPIAAIVNGTAYAVHSDHLNTPRKLTQPDGQVAWQWAYSAFGDEQPTLGAKRFTSETTTPTTGSTTIPEVTFNLRYPGQYYDKESNLHYNYFRSYSAERGRYTQADPIGLDGGFNRFGYVGGNPLKRYDFYGLAPGDYFVTQDEAAYDAMQYFKKLANVARYEWASAIYYDPAACRFSYTLADSQEEEEEVAVPVHLIPNGSRWTGDIHNHPVEVVRWYRGMGRRADMDNFSDRDILDSIRTGTTAYLINSKWQLMKFDPRRLSR